MSEVEMVAAVLAVLGVLVAGLWITLWERKRDNHGS